MILLKKNYQWTPQDSKTDERFSFLCPQGVREIRILFSYDPDALLGEKDCAPLIEKAMEQYYDGREPGADVLQVPGMCPLKNLITLSLSREGVYVGNGHRWAGRQVHRLTQTGASPGFLSIPKLSGQWEGMLHLHAVCTPVCQGILVVEGRADNEVVSG